LSLADRLPSVFPIFDDSTDFATWLEAHQDEADRLEADLKDVQESLQVAHATGDDLDRIGADFGILGRRRGRDDASYRKFIQSLVQAYRGRGTNPDVRTVVAAGILATKEDVALIEDTDANRYEVVLENEAWTAHASGVVRELANVADPSVVQRRDPVHNILSTGAIAVAASPTEISSGTTLDTGGIVVDEGVATKESVAVGLSAPELQPLSTDDWVLSTVERPAAVTIVDAGDTQIRSMHTSLTASITVNAGETTTRPMTRAEPARIQVDEGGTVTKTLSERGLSSGQLGGLSTTGISPLSEV
jgi:3',5'-cyclic AMP phosphodiesterase CpdA